MDTFKLLSFLVVGIIASSQCESRSENVKRNLVLPTCCNLGPGNPPDSNCASPVARRSSVDVSDTSTWEVPAKLMQNPNGSRIFSLQNSGEINCKGEDLMLEKVQLNIYANTSGIQFSNDGTLKFKREYYETKKGYCIDGLSSTDIRLKLCKPDCKKENSVCLPKCCAPGQMIANMKCGELPPGIKWKPDGLYKTRKIPVSSEEYAEIQPHYIQSNIQCSKISVFNYYSESKAPANLDERYLRFRILTDGRVVYRDHTRSWIYMSRSEYCVDGDSSSGEISTVIFTCAYHDAPIIDRVDFQIYPILMIISSLFILVTIALYILLWERQNIHGWNTMSQSFSMFMWFMFLGTASLLTGYRKDLFKSPICKIIAILSHYFMLTTFLWLTLISYDLWATFRSITPTSGRSKGILKFVIYSLIGWGLPLAAVIASFTLDILYLADEDSEFPLPEYGETSCYVATYSQWYYVYAPVAILMVINVTLFVYTAIKLYKYRESTKMATKQMKNQQHSFELFGKLFFVMGISWIFEVISWAVSGGGLSWYWFIFDAINIATPIAIFVIFVVKWDILYQLEQKYPSLKPLIIPLVYLLQLFRCKRPDHIVEEFTSLKTNETSLSKSMTTHSHSSSERR